MLHDTDYNSDKKGIYDMIHEIDNKMEMVVIA